MHPGEEDSQVIQSPLPSTEVDATDSGLLLPKIAAVIPLYNGREFIEKSLRSVLEQTFAPDKVVIVDDGSTDDGAEVALKVANGDPRVVALTKPNGGQSSARNLGVSSTDCDLVAFLDQDDWWYPRHLEVLVRQFSKPRHIPLGWAYSDLDEYSFDCKLVIQRMLKQIGAQGPKRSVAGCILRDMYVLPSASLIAREAFDLVGGFDEGLSGYEDDDLFLRIFRAGYDNAFVDRSLSAWRIHGGSSSYSPRMARSAMRYMNKLVVDFPDDAARHRYYRRDLIAPRFIGSALVNYRGAIDTGDPQLCATALADIDKVISHLRLRPRLLLRLLRPFFQIKPLFMAFSTPKIGRTLRRFFNRL